MKKSFRSILNKALIIAFIAFGFVMARPITAYADDLVLESVTIEGRDYLTPGCSAQYKITCIFNNNVEDKLYYVQSKVATKKTNLTSGSQTSTDWVDGNKYIRIEFCSISSGSTGTISVDWNEEGGVRTPESNTVKTVTFSKAPLTITAKDKSYPYNGQTQGPGDTVYDNPADIAEWVSVEGLQSGDRLTGITIDGQGQQAGSYPLRPSNAITEVTNGDTISDDYYDIEYVEGKLTITKPSPAPTPSEKTKDDDDDDDHDDKASTPASKSVNPNAIISMSFTGTTTGTTIGNAKIGPQVQGPIAQQVFKLNTPAGWKEAFSFNMTVNDKADHTLKKGTLSFKIPYQYQKTGRRFAILGLDRKGNVKVFNDIDTKADTITVNLDIEGYAFDLIYLD